MKVALKNKSNKKIPVFNSGRYIDLFHCRKWIGKINKDILENLLNLDEQNENISEKLFSDKQFKMSTTISKLKSITNKSRFPIPMNALLVDSIDDLKRHIYKKLKQLGINNFVESFPIAVREKLTIKDHIIVLKIACDLKNKQNIYYSKVGEPSDSISIDKISSDKKIVAENIRKALGFDLNKFRSYIKISEAREYCINLFEKKGVFVSLGTNASAVMPVQTGERKIGAFWIPNEKCSINPRIFIDTKDDIQKDKDPIGRQIFGMFLMLVYYLYNYRNLYINQSEFTNTPESENFFYEVVAEILLPKDNLIEERENYNSDDFSFIKDYFKKFNVTPTFLLYSMQKYNILKSNPNELKNQIAKEIKEKFAKSKTGKVNLNYSKSELLYAGRRYTVDILRNESRFSRKSLSYALFGKEHKKMKFEDKIKKIKDLC